MTRPRFVSTIASGALAVALTISATACSSSSTDDTTVAASVETTSAGSTATEVTVIDSTAIESTSQPTPDTSAVESTPVETPAPTPETSVSSSEGGDADASNIDVAVNIEGLPLDSPADMVTDKLGEPTSKSPTVEEGATGEFVSTWTWPDSGVTAKMAGASANGPYVVRALTIAEPSALKTTAGIGIGSTEADVRAAYGKGVNAESTPELIIVGSVYGGLLVSIFEGKVVEIFVGAAAE